MRPDERRERVGHRSTEPDRTYRVSGMSQARFAMSMAPRRVVGCGKARVGGASVVRGPSPPLGLDICVGSLLYGCLRPAGAAARKVAAPSLAQLARSQIQLDLWIAGSGGGGSFFTIVLCHCRHAVAGCKAAERQINAAHGRKLVAPAPLQLRWKSMLVNHVKYDATRVTGTVSGTSRQ